MPSEIVDRLLEFVAPLYANKDTMHDLSHIRRIHRKAIELAENINCDPQALEIAAILHGVIHCQEDSIRQFLLNIGLKKAEVENFIGISLDSQKESSPKSNEGKILHDAHLLEGDKNFIITKVLVTGSARGQTLEETINYYQEKLHGRHHCCYAHNQDAYEKREKIAYEYLEKLKSEL